MEEDENGEDFTPFWVQSTARGERLRRSVSDVFFSLGLVIFLLLVIAVFFLVFVVPSTLSFSVNIFRPNSVKKSWDSLNVVLVLVAVVFGFLSRNKSEKMEKEVEMEFRESSIKESEESLKSNPNKWYGYSDQEAKSEQKKLGLRRNVNSYPDLHQVSSVYWGYEDLQRRYYDDIYVESSRAKDPDPDPGHIQHRRYRSLGQVDYLREEPPSKAVVVDTLVIKSVEAVNPPLPSPSPAVISEENTNERERSTGEMEVDSIPAPPPEESEVPEFEENQRLNERVARKRERSSRRWNKNVESATPITTPPPPPPPPPRVEQKSSKSEKKRGGSGSSAKDFLNSLYTKKKKKQRHKSVVDNIDSLLREAQPPPSFQIPPPPPPPPPPSAFQNLFLSKKHKRKRTITVKLEPYPPVPPPPPPRRKTEPSSQSVAVTARKPITFEDASYSGGESPFNGIPAPPPPPPAALLRRPAWKFVVQGDYVRVNSSNSSRSGSPDPYETESDITPSGEAATPLFWQSPDVDTKAETFISSFRAKLKLEKNNSMKKKEPGLSSLGPKRI